ncbi:MAG: cell division protein SepF [Firmicutes bacterium]|nr:cell division protein SepF [Bacillota bacterium]
MAKVFDKFLNVLGFEVVEEDEPQNLIPAVKNEEKEELNWYEKKMAKRQEKKEERRSELVAIPNKNNIHSAKMVVCHLKSFDAVRQVADQLRENYSVVVDLTELSLDQAQRVLDYLSGVIFAIEGNASRVGSGIFLFAPPNVSIEGAVDLMFTDEKDKTEETTSSEKINSILKTVGA